VFVVVGLVFCSSGWRERREEWNARRGKGRERKGKDMEEYTSFLMATTPLEQATSFQYACLTWHGSVNKRKCTWQNF